MQMRVLPRAALAERSSGRRRAKGRECAIGTDRAPAGAAERKVTSASSAASSGGPRGGDREASSG